MWHLSLHGDCHCTLCSGRFKRKHSGIFPKHWERPNIPYHKTFLGHYIRIGFFLSKKEKPKASIVLHCVGKANSSPGMTWFCLYPCNPAKVMGFESLGAHIHMEDILLCSGIKALLHGMKRSLCLTVIKCKFYAELHSSKESAEKLTNLDTFIFVQRKWLKCPFLTVFF